MAGTNRGMTADATGSHINQQGTDDVPSLAKPIGSRLEITHRPFRTGYPPRGLLIQTLNSLGD